MGENWGKEHNGDLAGFSAWVSRSVNGSSRPVAEGMALAKKRRAALGELIESNTPEVFASAVPDRIRRRLPIELIENLEVPISGIGDLSVLGAIPAKGGAAVELIRKFVTLNGKTYRAYTYGRRAFQTSKQGIPLHGFVVDGVMALHESALRELEPGETPDPSLPLVDLRTPAEKATGIAPPVLAEMGSKIYGFASADQLRKAEHRFQEAEARLGPMTSQPAEILLGSSVSPPIANAPPPPNTWTKGNKNVLVIRVDFSDKAGDPDGFSAAAAQNLIDSEVSTFYAQSSYGQTSLTNTVTTQLYRMPRTAYDYATTGDDFALHAAAQNAAAANYTLANYDRIAVLFGGLGGISGSKILYAGSAGVGGASIWINGGYDFRVLTHELGHTYGLYHAGLWVVTDGNPISSSGTNSNYGDDYDIMGLNNSNDMRCDFNAYYKYILEWITDAQVQTITSNGTYRINQFDNSTGTGTLALKMAKDATRTYWVGIRRKFADNLSMKTGAYIIWGFPPDQLQPGIGGGSQSVLLDMTTPGNSILDAALALGASFTDTAAAVTIRPISNGGTYPNEYMDILVNASSTWVDFAFSGFPRIGTYTNPYSTLEDGVNAVPAGGILSLKGPRSSSAPITISKPMTLYAADGVVTIGR